MALLVLQMLSTIDVPPWDLKQSFLVYMTNVAVVVVPAVVAAAAAANAANHWRAVDI